MREGLNAYQELMSILEKDEVVEAIVFGEWGWGGYDEPNPPAVPHANFGKLLTIDEAEGFMKGWSFLGGYGAPECYAVYVWTNKRIIWITQYDGATGFNSAPRNPTPIMPGMPGG